MTDCWEKLDLATVVSSTSSCRACREKDTVLSSHSILAPWPYSSAWWQPIERPLQIDVYVLTVAPVRIEDCCELSVDCHQTIDNKLAQAEDFSDKCPVYRTKILCLLQQEKQQDAQNLILAVLEVLGHPFPKWFLKIDLLREFLKARKKLKRPYWICRKSTKNESTFVQSFWKGFFSYPSWGGDPEYFSAILLFASWCLNAAVSHGRSPSSMDWRMRR